jgi:hypothetical protein
MLEGSVDARRQCGHATDGGKGNERNDERIFHEVLAFFAIDEILELDGQKQNVILHLSLPDLDFLQQMLMHRRKASGMPLSGYKIPLEIKDLQAAGVAPLSPAVYTAGQIRAERYTGLVPGTLCRNPQKLLPAGAPSRTYVTSCAGCVSPDDRSSPDASLAEADLRLAIKYQTSQAGAVHT